MNKISKKYYVYLIYIGLAVGILIGFGNVSQNEFINFDDGTYVVKNVNVNEGLSRESFLWAFGTLHGDTSYWHPLTWLSHILDCELYGLEPAGHHVTSLLIHILNSLLLFWVLKKMTNSIWPSAFVAAMFAFHPLQVESVAWIAERKNLLSGFFWILTMAAYLRYASRPTIGRYLSVLAAFGLGLMSKPTVVTLPFVLLLLDYWPLKRLQWQNQQLPESDGIGYPSFPIQRLIKEKIPLFVLAGVSCIITIIAQKQIGTVALVENLGLKIRISNALVSYVSYLSKLFYPVNLSLLYPHPEGNIPMWKPVVSVLILAGFSIVIFCLARRRRFLLVGWLWLLGTLVPVIGLVQVGSQSMADRYVYLPAIGIFIIVAWSAAEFLPKWRLKKNVLSITAGIIIVAILICTRLQVGYWRDDLSLFKHSFEVTENNFLMLNKYGGTLGDMGRLDESLKYCRQALEIKPNFYKAQNNIGATLFKQGQIDEAIVYFKDALQNDPEFAEARNNLGAAYLHRGRLNEAIECFEEVLRQAPDNKGAFDNLQIAREEQANINRTISRSKDAVSFAPDDPVARNDLGITLAKEGKLDDAIEQFLIALAIDPNFADAHGNLGFAFLQQKEPNEAVRHLSKAVKLKPELVFSHYILGQALQSLGRSDEAVAQFRESLRLKPDWVMPMVDLARLLAVQKQSKFHNPDEAIALAEKACALTDYKQPVILDVLAICYASAGRFDDAEATAQKALGFAESLKHKQLIEDIQRRLELYKTGKGYFESAVAPLPR